MGGCILWGRLTGVFVYFHCCGGEKGILDLAVVLSGGKLRLRLWYSFAKFRALALTNIRCRPFETSGSGNRLTILCSGDTNYIFSRWSWTFQNVYLAKSGSNILVACWGC